MNIAFVESSSDDLGNGCHNCVDASWSYCFADAPVRVLRRRLVLTVTDIFPRLSIAKYSIAAINSSLKLQE